jgi:hypothetical protein
MKIEEQEELTSPLSHEEVLELDEDMEQAAAVASLIYTHDTQPGVYSTSNNQYIDQCILRKLTP